MLVLSNQSFCPVVEIHLLSLALDDTFMFKTPELVLYQFKYLTENNTGENFIGVLKKEKLNLPPHTQKTVKWLKLLSE